MREDRLAELERKVQYLTDPQAILNCIARHARGCDRFDAELTTASYHDDGILEMGGDAIAGPAYGERANGGHAAIAEANLHHITTHLCEIDGDQAHAESYVLVVLLDKGGETARILSGRYIDRLEKRNDEWKIVLRPRPARNRSRRKRSRGAGSHLCRAQLPQGIARQAGSILSAPTDSGGR